MRARQRHHFVRGFAAEAFHFGVLSIIAPRMIRRGFRPPGFERGDVCHASHQCCSPSLSRSAVAAASAFAEIAAA